MNEGLDKRQQNRQYPRAGTEVRRAEVWVVGASGWHAVGSADGDVSDAIQRLREQVFSSGDYYQRWQSLDRELIASELEEMIEYMPLPEEDRQDTERSLARLRSGDQPESVDEAGFWAGPDGTHSILDVHRIDPDGGYGVIRILGSDEVEEVFGESPPAPDSVESRWPDLMQRIERYTAVAFEDSAGQLHVAGMTGD